MPVTFLDESIGGSAWAAEASGNVMFAFYDGTNGERCELSDVCPERWLRPFLPRI
jgi:hypothetical protein